MTIEKIKASDLMTGAKADIIASKINELIDGTSDVNTAVGSALSGDIVFKCTPATATASEVAQNRGAGIKQKETLTPVLVGDSLATAGNCKITVTSVLGVTEVTFALALADAQTGVVTKAKTALGLVSAITDNFTVGGAAGTITLEKKVASANDTTFEVKIEPTTCSDDLSSTISVNTTAGVAPYTRNVVVTLETAGGLVHTWFNGDIGATVAEVTAGNGAIAVADATPTMVAGTVTVPITYSGTFADGVVQTETQEYTHKADSAGTITVTVTSALITPEAVAVEVAQNDTAIAVATLVVAAINDNAVVSPHFIASNVAGTSATVTLTALVSAANDNTLAMGFVDTDTTAVTAGASTNGTAGVAKDTNTLSITQQTIAGATVVAKTSVETSIA